MSYDILLYPRTPGQDWDDVIAADEAEADPTTLQDPEALEQGVATFRRIETRLRDVLTGDLESWVAEETGGDVYGEISASQTGLQVELFAGSAAVSFPSTPDGDLDAVRDQARQAVRVVAEETGYEAYDPQKGAPFDGEFDDETGREAVRGPAVDQDMAVGAGPDSGATDPSAPPATGAGTDEGTAAGAAPARDPRQDPSFLRKRGILYVALGVLLTLFGLWRLVGGDGGWLTILVLGIGVMDLLGGLFMLSLSRRIAAAGSPTTDGTTTPDGTTTG